MAVEPRRIIDLNAETLAETVPEVQRATQNESSTRDV
jgi:hypothetical protein